MTAEPNTFRTVEEVTTVLIRHGSAPTSVGLGDPEPEPSWARLAATIDDWIAAHRADRRGYSDWKDD